MSVRNFSRRFRQSFGVTPTEFVMRARVEAACRRLEESRSTIEQVATECGFSSAELLRRAFHRTLGTVPSRARERPGASDSSTGSVWLTSLGHDRGSCDRLAG
jgi:transcriptional regulator GlxA family with amidase domain